MNFPEDLLDEIYTEADFLDFILKDKNAAEELTPEARDRADKKRRLLNIIFEAVNIYNAFPPEGPQTEEEELADMKRRAEGGA